MRQKCRTKHILIIIQNFFKATKLNKNINNNIPFKEVCVALRRFGCKNYLRKKKVSTKNFLNYIIY